MKKRIKRFFKEHETELTLVGFGAFVGATAVALVWDHKNQTTNPIAFVYTKDETLATEPIYVGLKNGRTYFYNPPQPK